MGNDRGQGRPLNAHIQAKNQQRVQHQIDDRAQKGGHHAGFPEALGVDKGVHPQADHDGDNARQINHQVVFGMVYRIRAASHQV